MRPDYNDISWEMFRDDIVAVAMDAGGEVWGYSKSPKLHSDMFCSACGSEFYKLDCIAWTNLPPRNQWRESLRLRPVEPPKPTHEWRHPDDNTPVDTLVWCRDSYTSAWMLHYFRGLSCDPYVITWKDGATSITANGRITHWHVADVYLANPDNLTQKP